MLCSFATNIQDLWSTRRVQETMIPIPRVRRLCWLGSFCWFTQDAMSALMRSSFSPEVQTRSLQPESPPPRGLRGASGQPPRQLQSVPVLQRLVPVWVPVARLHLSVHGHGRGRRALRSGELLTPAMRQLSPESKRMRGQLGTPKTSLPVGQGCHLAMCGC